MDNPTPSPAHSRQPASLTKEQINLLPLKRYEGLVEVVGEEEGLRAAVERLGRERVLGFDIEVKPSFKSGDVFPPSLVQLAGEREVCLVQLKKIGDLGPLGVLLADDRIVKAGVAVANDIAKLKEVVPFEPARFVELGNLAGRKGYVASGVRTLAANVLGFRISKGAQCSNWDRADLSQSQIAYAATDAWICRELYLCLEKKPDIFTNTQKKFNLKNRDLCRR